MARFWISRLTALFTPPIFVLTSLLALFALGVSSRQAQATIYYVSTTGSNFNTGLSWSSPKSDLQATIHAAVSGDQVWVKYGTYSESGNFTATDGVAVYGHFAGTESSTGARQLTNTAYATILNVSGSGGTVYIIYSTATVTNTLDGFTVENGGIGLSDSSSSDTLNVANCIFTNNSNGLYLSNEANTPTNTITITNCTFTGGNGGSAVFGNAATHTINGCTFTGNSSDQDGGAVLTDGGPTNITNCTFTNNSGGDGGAIFAEASSMTINGCTFTNNSASSSGGAVYIYGTTTTISDCTFNSNSAIQNGGGVFAFEAFLTIADCTFGGSSASDANTPQAIYLNTVGNTRTTPPTPAVVKDNLIIGMGSATTDADGIDIDTDGGTDYVTIANNTIVNTNVGINFGTTSGTISVANNIFYGDYGSLNDTGSATFTSSHNDNDNNVSYYYQGVNPSPTDLLSVNPDFVNAGSGNYRLASNSPLVNAGDDSYVMSGDTDLDGNPRIYGSHVDLGAYEYTPSGTPVPASLAFNPSSVASGAMTTGTVTLTLPAPTGGAVVTLMSSNTAAAPVPASVTVAAGATTATFKITTGMVTASTNVTITAKLNGTSVTGMLTVAPQSIASLTFSSYTITGGDALTGQVTLAYPAAASTTVTLAPGGSDSVPASVTIPANGTSATFTVRTSVVPAKIGASVTATLSSKSTKTGITLLPPQVTFLSLAPNAVVGGTPVMATVALNVPAPSGGITVNLTSSNTSEASVPSTVTVPAGASSASFMVTTYAVTGYTRVTIDSETTALIGAASLTLFP